MSDNDANVDWDLIQSQHESGGTGGLGIDTIASPFLTPNFVVCAACEERYVPVCSDGNSLCPACCDSFDSDTSIIITSPDDLHTLNLNSPSLVVVDPAHSLEDDAKYCQHKDCMFPEEPVPDSWKCKSHLLGCLSSFCFRCAAHSKFHSKYCKDCEYIYCECSKAEGQDCLSMDNSRTLYEACANVSLGCGARISTDCVIAYGAVCMDCPFIQQAVIADQSSFDASMSDSSHSGMFLPIEVYVTETSEWVPATANELVSFSFLKYIIVLLLTW